MQDIKEWTPPVLVLLGALMCLAAIGGVWRENRQSREEREKIRASLREWKG